MADKIESKVNILTWAWHDNPQMNKVGILTVAWHDHAQMHKVEREVANKLSVFRNRTVKSHDTEKESKIPVLKFRRVTTMAMHLLLDFLKEGVVPDLKDHYYYNAYPDLLRFINEKVTDEEYHSLGFEAFYTAMKEKMFESLKYPEDTNISKVKKAIIKYKVAIPEAYKGYF